MNRCRPIKQPYSRSTHKELLKKTAIHESGHAAAIYLGNKQKRLPPIFFQIDIKALSSPKPARNSYDAPASPFAQVIDGRLIHTLPLSVSDVTRNLSLNDRKQYLQAFEADIVNLLVGPLAEAKYVATSMDEPVNHRLVNLNSLDHFGGSSDLKTVREYLDCWLTDEAEKENKCFELFLAAYAFINDPNHWHAITVLADYLLASGKRVVDCEEIFAVLDTCRA